MLSANWSQNPRNSVTSPLNLGSSRNGNLTFFSPSLAFVFWEPAASTFPALRVLARTVMPRKPLRYSAHSAIAVFTSTTVQTSFVLFLEEEDSVRRYISSVAIMPVAALSAHSYSSSSMKNCNRFFNMISF
ncbi:hypothetical protein T07_7142 [Trichinella nelsoni]|uniref:Uncharacterized protein n=1 Tax=Trichinella nelsoni TaxID=6336 RepID=A0A0V0S5R8_9BILA|nr:hypothetical protein T07_7142 [Trichinella nelsoni]